MVLEELLAPAGSPEVLTIAVNAGADAVYIAGQNYGARAYAKNFTIEEIEKAYIRLIQLGATPQEARSILPNSLKTEIVITMNIREWRHFFKLRTAEVAHPQMKEIARVMLEEFKKKVPVLFDDISY